MHQSLPFVLAALVFGCRATHGASAETDDSTLAVLGPSSIVCGAVALTADLAVTASHCVPETVVNYLRAPDARLGARPGRGFVVVRDPASDLALFATSRLSPAELSDDQPDLGGVASMVAHVPSPWGVVTIHPSDMDDGFVRTERLRVGASGSGLWDSKWRLVGVAIGNDNQAGYFASAHRVAELLENVPRDAGGRIDTSSEPKVCASPAAGSHRKRPPTVNVPRLLAKVSEKSQRIDEGLTAVRTSVEFEQIVRPPARR